MLGTIPRNIDSNNYTITWAGCMGGLIFNTNTFKTINFAIVVAIKSRALLYIKMRNKIYPFEAPGDLNWFQQCLSCFLQNFDIFFAFGFFLFNSNFIKKSYIVENGSKWLKFFYCYYAFSYKKIIKHERWYFHLLW